MSSKEKMEQELVKDWNENPRWVNTKRPYTATDVINLRGQLKLNLQSPPNYYG